MITLEITCLILAVIGVVFGLPVLVSKLVNLLTPVHKPSRCMENADPLVLLNQAVEDGVASIQNAKQGLDNYRVLILSLQRQLENGEKEKSRLESRIRESLQAGDPHDAAREYAMMLADVEENLAANKEQLQRHRETYENFARQVEVGQSRVAAARQKASLLGLELEQSKREKEMARFARNFTFDPQSLDSDLTRAEELIYQTIDANRAAGHVAEDLSKPSTGANENEEKLRKTAAGKILERFSKETPNTETA